MTCSTYECAEDKFTNDVIVGPGYLTVVGINDYDGVIITRDRFGPAHIDQLTPDRWYVLQTNEDHWKGEGTTRYFTAVDRMNKIGRENVTPQRVREEVLV